MLQGKLEAICISETRGTPKKSIAKAMLRENYGIVGDAHAGNWHRQVSLLSRSRIAAFAARGVPLTDGIFGENLIVSGIDCSRLPVGTRLRLGDAMLEVTQIGKECHSHCAIYDTVGDCIMPREGIFAKVLQGGEIIPDMTISVPYRVGIVTASDRCAAGERQDESGRVLAELLPEERYTTVSYTVLPDEKAALTQEFIRLCDEMHCDLVLTTGGTGFSPRDITPEATQAVAERQACGIAEAIRLHSLEKTPRAMLSRGTAVLRGSTLIVNLPGSVKAVRECMEILIPTVEHGLDVLRGQVNDCGGIQ